LIGQHRFAANAIARIVGQRSG
jgi:hypothetical protein